MANADGDVDRAVDQVLNRWPVAGFSIGVVRGSGLEWSRVHGVADVRTGRPVDEDTVFRIGSVTKTMTAAAVMQLVEQRLVELDAPADRYLRSYSLRPRAPDFPPPTVRQLLSHTAGVRAVRTTADLLRPAMGWGAPRGQAPPLSEYYRGGLRVDTRPGSAWAYTNHGFATLGQIVEDVTGMPFAAYLRERLFAPLGMDSTDAVRSDRVEAALATGYELRSRGLRPARDLEVVPAGCGAVYSTLRDLARYAAAWLGGGANEHGRVLEPATVSAMFAPQYRPDDRLPGMGLSFFRGGLGGHRMVAHDGIWLGFLSTLLLAPDDDVAVVALSNTGRFRPGGAPAEAAEAVLRTVLDLPEDVVRTDVPTDPRTWPDLCGWYSLGPGVLTNPQPRMMFGAGVEVAVSGNHLVVRLPVAPARVQLHPHAGDPDLFSLDLSRIGAGICPVAFARAPDGSVTAMHTQIGMHPTTFLRGSDARNPRRWLTGAAAAGVTAAALRRRRTRRRRQ